MENSSFLRECQHTYKTLEKEIENRALELADDLKWMEWAFGLALQTWLRVEKMANDHSFLNQQEEISFYKTWKPRFTALIDYFSFVYKSVLLQPGDSKRRNTYWNYELKKCGDLILKYQEGCCLYEQQADTELYFLKQNNQQPLLFGMNISALNFTTFSYCYLLGRIMAMEKYMNYIQVKINKTVPSVFMVPLQNNPQTIWQRDVT